MDSFVTYRHPSLKGKRVMIGGVPAVIFSVAIAMPCDSAQVSGYASPPPTPISASPVPARDTATATVANPKPARYVPPVHVPPPANPMEFARRQGFANRVTRTVFDGESVNGRRNTTQQVSYPGRTTIATLSDVSLAEPQRAPATAAKSVTSSNFVASKQDVGLYGFKDEPTLAQRPAAAQVRNRPAGLQDRISMALKRTTGKRGVESSGYVDEGNVTNHEMVESANYDRRSRREGSGSFYRQELVQAERSRRKRKIDQRDQYDVALVNQEQSLVENRAKFATGYQQQLGYSEPEIEYVDEEIQPHVVAKTEEVTAKVQPPHVAQLSRPHDQRSIERIRGRQVSILSSGQVESREASSSQAEDLPNRLRPNQNELGGFGTDQQPSESLDADEPAKDFDPLEDGTFDARSREDDMKELDDLDRGIDRELDRLRVDEDDLIDDGDDDSIKKPPIKDCETFRNELLTSSIRDIALDISPPASTLPGSTYPVARSWTDQNGNVIATGAMRDLRRGYVILDNGQKIAYAKLSEADWAVVSEFWRLPTVCSVGDRGNFERCWIPQTFTWTASNLCHKTLFFENIQLERYGHSHGPFTQPVQSVAHFFASLVTVPYQAAIHPANECHYALGYYRPGNCAPWLKDPIPISLDGARRQALVATGIAFIP